MKICLRIIPRLAALFLLSSEPAAGQTTADEYYRQWVDYRDGEISVDFDQIPVMFALHVIHAKTGFQIVIPSPSQARVLNLRLQRQPLEPAIRSLISTIGYQSFALLYDDSGRPSRAVVLGTQPVPAKATEAAAKTEPSRPALNAEEQDKLQKELTRWHELKQEERSRIENRLKELEPSEEREQLINEYGKQLLRLAK
jgi:hypothetical protein